MHRIILDTDLSMGAPGSEIDDGFALAIALAEPQIQIDMITTVNGNIDVGSATLLTCELANRLNFPEIPVFRGAAAPMTRPDLARDTPAEVLEKYGHRSANPGYAAAEMARHVMSSPGEITVVAIGPLTNVAAAISLESRFARSVREIVIMGGMFLGQTLNSAMPGEFNVWADPEAAEAVLRSGAIIRWVGLDVTLQVRLSVADAHTMKDSSHSFSAFAGEAALAWIDTQRDRHPGDSARSDSCAMHDPLAVAVVAHPDLVSWSPAHVAVVTGSSIARGAMVTDLLRSKDAPPPNCMIATAVDVHRFMDYFIKTVTSI